MRPSRDHEGKDQREPAARDGQRWGEEDLCAHVGRECPDQGNPLTAESSREPGPAQRCAGLLCIREPLAIGGRGRYIEMEVEPCGVLPVERSTCRESGNVRTAG